MKKILLSLLAVLCFGMANAETEIDLGLYTWQSWDNPATSVYDDASKTLSFDGAWNGGQFSIDAVDASGYDYILFTIDNSSVSANVAIKGWWGDGMDVSTTYESGKDYAFIEINEDWEKGMNRIQQIQFQGHAKGGLIINKVSLCSKEEMAALGLIKLGVYADAPMAITDGCHILSQEFDAYSDDTEVKIIFDNNVYPTSRSGWGIGSISNIGNWSSTPNSISLKGGDGAQFSNVFTVGELKNAAKNGTSDYIMDSYDRTGVTLNVYNDCQLAGACLVLPATEITAPGDSKYFSYVTESALDFEGSGLKAYIATASSATAVTVTEVTKVPAGTAVVLLDDGNTSYKVAQIASATLPKANLLLASTGSTASNAYALNADGEFAPVESSVVIPAGKAYIQVAGEAKALDIVVDGDDATAIKNISNGDVKGVQKKILNGRVVIVNGDKVYSVTGALLK